jgi:hypothetical protein
MSIKKDIEILINSISSIEDRHLLELIAVYDGLKDVMRIHINFHNEYLALKSFGEKYNLIVNHTPFKLKVDWTNDIGDTFLKSVSWEDNTTEMFVAYISNNAKIINKALTIESDSTNLEAGLLYQYPNCCCINYDKISNGELWSTLLLDNSKGTFFSPWANKLSYLVYEFCLFPDYFPCSLDCNGTIQLSKEYYELALKYDLKSFAKLQLEYMSGLYLINEDLIISTKIYNVEDNYININLTNSTTYKINKDILFNNLTDDKYLIDNQDGNSFITMCQQKYRILIFE